MPLSQSTLATQLLNAMSPYPTTFAQAGQDLAQAYAAYAQQGTFGVCLIPTLAPQQSALAGVLAGSFASMTAAGAASAWSSGLATFWTGVPVAGPGQAGATASCPGAGAITAGLIAVFASMPPTQQAAANAIAAVLHTATLTVTAVVAPPPGTVVPIL